MTITSYIFPKVRIDLHMYIWIPNINYADTHVVMDEAKRQAQSTIAH